jgi:hypothetical protein
LQSKDKPNRAQITKVEQQLGDLAAMTNDDEFSSYFKDN